MKHFKYILLILVIAVSSCKKDFLAVEDNSLLNRQSYVKSLSSMQEYVRGIYLQLALKYEHGYEVVYPGIIADEIKPGTATRPLALHCNWSQVADGVRTNYATAMNNSWMNTYQIIRTCNFVIEDVDKYESENKAKANDLKGQAYGIRALLHLRMANVFAQHYKYTADASHPGVPYITTSDITKPYSRQSVAEVYNSIIADLENAISLLPATVTDTRFMNRVAAKAVLARIYLYQEEFAKAKTLAVELVNQFPLMTIANGYPVDLFKLKQLPDTEIFFQITPVLKDNAVNNFLGIYALLNYHRPTADIALAIRQYPNDARNAWVTEAGSNWRITKFPSSVAGGLGSDPSTDYYSPVVRSSEMFLTAAETAAKTNDEPAARLYLNAVRRRADPSLSDVSPTGAALLDSIYKERRKELAFEGFRMWDLQRWKVGVQRTDVVAGFQTTLPYPSNKAIAPIPGQDVAFMGLQQNAGY